MDRGKKGLNKSVDEKCSRKRLLKSEEICL